MNYKNLNLSVNTDEKIITVNDNFEIKIKQYLPLKDKYDLITIVLNNSEEDGIYNPLYTDAYFHLGLVYLYTDIDFSEEDKIDEAQLYDELVSNGIMNIILDNFNESEYNHLISLLEKLIADKMKYSTTAASLISKMIVDLPENADAAKKIMDSFDKERFKEVINFATAANGGRDIVLKTVE